MGHSPWGGKELDMTKQLTFSLEITSVGKGVENREPSCIVDGNVNWCNHYGKQYGDYLKN